jgi:hypothetical protein
MRHDGRALVCQADAIPGGGLTSDGEERRVEPKPFFEADRSGDGEQYHSRFLGLDGPSQAARDRRLLVTDDSPRAWSPDRPCRLARRAYKRRIPPHRGKRVGVSRRRGRVVAMPEKGRRQLPERRRSAPGMRQRISWVITEAPAVLPVLDNVEPKPARMPAFRVRQGQAPRPVCSDPIASSREPLANSNGK